MFKIGFFQLEALPIFLDSQSLATSSSDLQKSMYTPFPILAVGMIPLDC